MINLKKIAILLIYEDGTKDYLNIEEDKLHIKYYKKLRKKSSKFKEITKELSFEGANHYEIDAFLASKGTIVFYNNNLAEMAAYPEKFDDDFDPFFVVCLPENYGSQEQKKFFYKIIKHYNSDYLYFGKYSQESGYLEDGENINEYVLQDELMISSHVGKRR